VIRDGRPGDVEAMGWAASDGQRLEWLGQYARTADGEVDFLVAEVDGRIVGKVVLDWVRRQDGSAWLWMGSVHPDYRGRGIGSQALAEAELRARARGCAAMEMSVDDVNPRARELYLRRGYVEAGPYVDEHDEVDTDGRMVRVSSPGVLLRKTLDRWYPGDQIAVRYLDRADRVLAVLPMTVAEDSGDRVVAWLAPDTPIMYWAAEDGTDPRLIPVEHRFDRPFISRARTWEGGGVLRVLMIDDTYSAVHFWERDGSFARWHVNLESSKVRWSGGLDTQDYLLDLFVEADGSHSWKDEDEAAVAVAVGALAADDLAAARATGERIVRSLASWPVNMVGDWRGFGPDPAWPTPSLSQSPHWLGGIAT
jgi:GNAT superfamily N-acetyltransferase